MAEEGLLYPPPGVVGGSGDMLSSIPDSERALDPLRLRVAGEGRAKEAVDPPNANELGGAALRDR